MNRCDRHFCLSSINLNIVMSELSKIDAVIHELLERHQSEKEKPHEFKEGMLAMGSEGGRLVETIIRMRQPKLGLEIGTSSGFSALCAIRGDMTGEFKLITVDYDPAKAMWARENFERAGVTDRVEIITEDGLKAVQKLTGPFDFVLLDATKKQNLPLMEELLPKLTIGSVVLTDNVTTHTSEMLDFLDFVRNHPQLASGLMKVGNGIEFTVKLAPRLTDEIVAGDR